MTDTSISSLSPSPRNIPPLGGVDPRLIQPLVPGSGQGIEILLQRVPEAKSGKNRLHLDLRTVDLAGEVEGTLALGARRLISQPVTETG
jgi:hypothetical protein